MNDRNTLTLQGEKRGKTEFLSSLDIQTEAIHDRKTLTFWGEKWGKTEFLSSLKIFPKKIAIVVSQFISHE